MKIEFIAVLGIVIISIFCFLTGTDHILAYSFMLLIGAVLLSLGLTHVIPAFVVTGSLAIFLSVSILMDILGV